MIDLYTPIEQCRLSIKTTSMCVSLGTDSPARLTLKKLLRLSNRAGSLSVIRELLQFMVDIGIKTVDKSVNERLRFERDAILASLEGGQPPERAIANAKAVAKAFGGDSGLLED